MAERLAPRIGIVLTEDLAARIYQCKLDLKAPQGTAAHDTEHDKTRGKSVPVSIKFGVSPKTIRDIWTRRTWASTTSHLWHLEDDSSSCAYPKVHNHTFYVRQRRSTMNI